MSKDLTQGQKANRNGKILEDILAPIFKINGYDIYPFSFYKKHKKEFEQYSKFVLTNVPYTSIYGHQGRTEYLIVNRFENRKIRVEAKWQQSNGSVDEKFPYVWLNSVLAFEEDEVILIIDGKGYKESAYDWLKKQEAERWLIDDPQKDIKVFHVSEFIEYFNRSLAI